MYFNFSFWAIIFKKKKFKKSYTGFYPFFFPKSIYFITSPKRAPRMHKMPKIKVNLEKLIFEKIFIKKCKVKMPVKKEKNKASREKENKFGSFK
jgi:hypothetical protein